MNYTILKIVVLSIHYLLCISSSDFQKNCVLLSYILTELNRKTFLTKYKLTKLYLLGTRPNLLRFKYDWNVYIVQSCQLIPPNYNLHNIIKIVNLSLRYFLVFNSNSDFQQIEYDSLVPVEINEKNLFANSFQTQEINSDR